MTVYIEYVILDNFIIDYFLLKTSLALSGIPFKSARLFFCSILGAGFALLIPIISASAVILALVKVCFGLLMVLLSSNFKSKREFFIPSIIFFSFTFLVGGAIIGAFSLLGLDYSSEISVAIMFVPVYFVVKGLNAVIKHLYQRKNVQSLVFETEITLLKNTIKCRGFLDTGNGVYDGVRPVIICSTKFAKQLLGEQIARVKLKRLNVSTVNGKKHNLAVELQEVKIYNLDKVNIFNNVTLCVVRESVGDGYDVILHPALIKGEDDEQTIIKAKKVS